MKYIYPETDVSISYFAANSFATYFILFNSLIPLAMIVTLEISKLVYSKMIEHDVELIKKDDIEMQECRVQNLTLHE
jgi:magnesium-transporting ATPase (P-type)